ncbi:hypothetical protein QP787_07915, partial [Actinotignum sanguinis]|nr:hypothetical protein [Actinotignum sanguinis]
DGRLCACRHEDHRGIQIHHTNGRNPTTLAKDLGLLDGFAVHEARLMDMFPQTGHMECMVLAERVD